MHARTAGLALAAALIACGTNAGLAAPVPQLRAFWVVQGHLLGDELFLQHVVRMTERVHANAILAQVDARGYAQYRSEILPWAAGVNEAFDPLARLIELAHARGIQVHAWINAFSAGEVGVPATDPRHVAAAHPDWFTVDRFGTPVLRYDRDHPLAPELAAPMLDPSVPKVQQFVASLAREVVRRYDVDGVHLDYIRYASRNFGYHAIAREAFRARCGVDPLELATDRDRLAERYGAHQVRQWEQAWDDLRREQVTATVRHIHAAVKEQKPWVRLSAAVFSNARTAREWVLQDWPAWLSEGIVDAVAPMAYYEDPDQLAEDVRQALESARRSPPPGGPRQVWAGVGAYKVYYDRARTMELVRRAQETGADGVLLFSFNEYATDFRFFEELAAGPFRDPALPPAMPWLPPRP